MTTVGRERGGHAIVGVTGEARQAARDSSLSTRMDGSNVSNSHESDRFALARGYRDASAKSAI